MDAQWVLRIRAAQGSSEFVPTRPAVTLGRAPDNDVVLQDALVSGHHARLMVGPEGCTITDLGSTNGTFLNGQRLQPQAAVPVGAGDTLTLGQCTLTLEQAATSASAPATSASARPSVGQPTVMGPDRRQGSPVSGPPPSGVPRADDGGARRPPGPSQPAASAQRAYAVLSVRLADGSQGEHPLLKPTIALGRADDNDVVLDGAMVSGHHLQLAVAPDGQVSAMDLGSLNGTRVNGQPLSPRRAQLLRPGDVIQLQEFALGVRPVTAQAPAPASVAARVRVTAMPPLVFRPVGAEAAAPGVAGGRPSAQPPAGGTQMLALDAQESITIGRSPENTITLDHPLVSRYHALIERLGTRRRIKDLKSANGVFVNGQRIDEEAWLQDGDVVHIGPVKLRLAAGQVHQMAEEGVRLDAIRINKWVTKDLNLLKDISLSIQPLEFVALVGLSGSGKSTLMDAINGFRPATHGAVMANGTNLYENFDLFRNDMGYVPQKDIVHTELTVYKALDYAAQLRMPADTEPEERHRRIMEVLTDLDLEERRDLPISKLSGGQLKRVSIGVELLTKPRLFFLDEPTSGLDPGTEFNMMRLLRKLADQGRTIVLITHATKNVMMCDKVIILVRGGRIAFFGPPEEALVYFDEYRTEYERRIKDMEFDDIYTILEDERRGKPEEWDERYRSSTAYRKYVVDRIQTAPAEAGRVDRAVVRQRPAKRVSALRQFTILSLRNLNIMTQDKASLALMLALSPIIGLADFMWGRQLFSAALGDAFNIITMLFMMGLIAILVGAMASVREIVKEIDIYKRERAIALKIGPYVFSKLWVGVVLALYQALVFILTKAILVGFAPPQLTLVAWVGVFITLFIGSFSGYLMGLAISAGSPNQMVALLMVILVLVPQFLFAGALMPLDLIPGGRVISAAATTRWAFGAFVRLSEVGEQLADDGCWPEDRTLEGDERGWNEWLQAPNDEKMSSCACMGPNLFTRCDDFPGVLNPEFFDLTKPDG
ncbi:MAG: FHA domain-containing protein, partial [Anaerolineae bacterium]|nr:FHA domain-containing protein [Anaerolineae bacterium]